MKELNTKNEVFACVTGVAPSEAICDWAAWLALKSNLNVRIYHTIPTESPTSNKDLTGNLSLGESDELLQELVEIEHDQNRLRQRRGKVIVEKSKKRVQKSGVKNVESTLETGRLIDNLTDLKDSVNTVVIGRYGQNHLHNPKGAVGHHVEAVVRELEKPVLVVSDSFTEPKGILIAYDGSPASKKAVQYFMSSSAFKNLDIFIVHFGDQTESVKSEMNEITSSLQQNSYLNVTSHFISSEIESSLQDFVKSNGIGLTIMGAFGHHWLKKLIVGSFTSKMLRVCPTALMLIR